MMVKVADVWIGKRLRKKHENIQALATSLESHGQLQNILLRKPREGEEVDNKPYVLVAGGRRMAAIMFLGWEEVRAEMLEDKPEWQQLEIELEENLQRENMDWFDVVEAKARIHELQTGHVKGWTQQQTAEKIGDNVASLSRDLQLAHAVRKNPELKKASSKKQAMQIVKQKAVHESRKLATQTIDYSAVEQALQVADMRDYLLTLPPKSVNLCLTDLPYGIDYFDLPQDTNQKGGGISAFDDSTATMKDTVTDMIPKLLRVMKPNGWITLMMCAEHYDFLKCTLESCCVTHGEYGAVQYEQTSRGEWVRIMPEKCSKQPPRPKPENKCRFLRAEIVPWIWYRPNSRNNPQHPDKHAQNQYELILVANMGEGVIFSDGKLGNVFAVDSEYSERFHAHQKPVELGRRIINALTIAGETVLDLCHGSGAFLRAAVELNRLAKGCDLNPAMHDPAVAYVSEVYTGTKKTGLQREQLTCAECGRAFSYMGNGPLPELCKLCQDPDDLDFAGPEEEDEPEEDEVAELDFEEMEDAFFGGEDDE